MSRLGHLEELQLELFPEPEVEAQSSLRIILREAAPPQDEDLADEAEEELDAMAVALAIVAPADTPRYRYVRNRGAIMTWTRGSERRPPELLIHDSFRRAPREVAEALARLVLRPMSRHEQRAHRRAVLSWHASAAPPETLAAGMIRPGQHQDLEEHLRAVNAEWFAGALDLLIGFAPRTSRRLMGRHERADPKNAILINPLLDRPEIATWYLRFLVFHEGLHEQIPPRWHKGRLLIHPPEFREAEGRHPDQRRARSYERWLTDVLWPAIAGRPAAQEPR